MNRADRLAQITEGLKDGLTHREIADRLGLRRTTIRNILYDPDGTKIQARRDAYRGECVVCGAATSGSDGRAKAPRHCREHNPATELAPCGTRSAYERGCRCDACKAANNDYMRSLRQRRQAPNHGVSGYRNYGCRCDICRAAHSALQRDRRAKAAA